MDYDQTTIPETYDRARKQEAGVLEMRMERIAAALAGRNVSTIIDLGCGTGRFSGALAARFGAGVVAIDPSQKMLAQARAKAPARVTFESGSGEDIPCADASADVVFSSMTFHHFRNPRTVAGECRRVLRENGAVCFQNSTREQASPYDLYFPNYRQAHAILPAAADIVDAFASGGFALQSHDIVPHMMAKTLEDLADKAAFRADSTLVALSDADFEQGLANLRATARTERGPAMINIDLFVFARV